MSLGIGRVLDRESADAARSRVVREEPPVVGGKGAGGGVVEEEAEIVLLENQGVEPEVQAVDAVEAGAGAALDDEVVGDDEIQEIERRRRRSIDRSGRGGRRGQASVRGLFAAGDDFADLLG